MRSVPLENCCPLTQNRARSQREKRERWADTLRTGNTSASERHKRMEQGWDDSNVIIYSKERKIEFEEPFLRRRNSLPPKKIQRKEVKRTQSGSGTSASLNEWRELFELASARKQGKGSNYLKRLEALMENNKAPRGTEVIAKSQKPRPGCARGRAL